MTKEISDATVVMDTSASPSTRLPPAKRLLWMLGPALVAGVAYLDPGNVAANMSAGAQYGYLLVWVVISGNIMAWLVQYLSAKLGVVTGKSLPEVLRERFGSRAGRLAYWIQAEAVAMATDIAEVIGGAVALYLLFGLPLLAGGLITGVISMSLLLIQSRRGPWVFERIVIGLLLIIAVGFCAGVVIAPPEAAGLAGGLIPASPTLIRYCWRSPSWEPPSCPTPFTPTRPWLGTDLARFPTCWPFRACSGPRVGMFPLPCSLPDR